MVQNLLFGIVGWGVFTFILGNVVVFLGMTVIIACVSAVGAIMKKNDAKKTEKAEKAEVSEIQAETAEEIPEEVKVAIIAAISAYYMQEGAKNEFKVRKIRKI